MYLITEELFVEAGLIVFLCMLFDFMDGMVARKMNAMSSFGAIFDVMTDFVAFAVVPGILLFRVSLNIWGILGLFIVIIYVFSGCYRLIRFYLTSKYTESKSSFVGLPIPAAAGFISSLVIFFLVYVGRAPDLMVLSPVLLAVSALMISKIEFMAIDSEGKICIITRVLGVVAALTLVLFYRYYYLSFFFWLLLYIVYHFLRHLLKVIAGKVNTIES